MWFFWQFVCFRPKKGWVKKKSSKNFAFFVFFWKMTKFWPTLKLSKFVFFFNETRKLVHNILLNTFQIILGWNKHIQILLWYFYSTCGKTIIFWEKLKFFPQGIYCFWKKQFFYFFVFLEKFVILWKKKNILTPSF